MKMENFPKFLLLVPVLASMFAATTACEKRSAAEIFPEYAKKEATAAAIQKNNVSSDNQPVDYFPAVD